MQIKNLSMLVLLLVSCALRAEVTESLSYKFYSVSHTAGSSLIQAVNAASPIRTGEKKYHGNTKWEVHWKYLYDQSSARNCKVKSVSVALSAMITLPELHSNDVAAIRQFNQYLPALKRHELGHLQTGQDAARRIEQSLLQYPAQATCEQLGAALNQRGNALLAEAVLLDRAYDEQTQHGKTQGAELAGR